MLAREAANLNICLVHAGMLTATDDATVSEWRDALKVLVPCENVFIKVSGLNTYSRRLDETVMDIFANTVLDMFGPDRCFFGSNFLSRPCGRRLTTTRQCKRRSLPVVLTRRTRSFSTIRRSVSTTFRRGKTFASRTPAISRTIGVNSPDRRSSRHDLSPVNR